MVAVAVKACCWPEVTVGFAGDTTIPVRVPFVTFRVAVPLMEPEVAVMVLEPAATPVATPVLLIVAMDGSEEVHVTFDSVFVLPSS